MEVNIHKIETKVSLIPKEKRQHENLLANASITLKDDSGEYFTITGFTVWKSKFEGYNVKEPSRPGFKYILSEPSFWKKIKKAITEQYEYESVPVIENDEPDPTISNQK